MLRKNGLRSFILLASIGILLFASFSCTKTNPQQAASATTQSADNTYKVLNPQGLPLPVTITPLATRLDSLTNKTIYVVFNEPVQIVTQALLTKLKTDYPKTTWKSITGTDFGAYVPEAEVMTNAQAVIRGNAWWATAAATQAVYVSNAEKSGIPCVLLGYSEEKDVAEQYANGNGSQNIRFVNVPDKGSGSERVNTFFSAMIKALTDPLTDTEKGFGTFNPPQPPRVLFEGSLEDAQNYFQASGSYDPCNVSNY
jgi:hypothetical protein